MYCYNLENHLQTNSPLHPSSNPRVPLFQSHFNKITKALNTNKIISKSQKGSSKTAPSHLPLGLNTGKTNSKISTNNHKKLSPAAPNHGQNTSYPNTMVSFNSSSRFIFLLTQDPLIPYNRSNFLFIYHFRNTSTNSVFSIQAETWFGIQTPLRNLVIKAFSFHLSTIFKLLSLFPPLLCQSILPYDKTPCRFAPLGKFWCGYSHTKPYNASSPAPTHKLRNTRHRNESLKRADLCQFFCHLDILCVPIHTEVFY